MLSGNIHFFLWWELAGDMLEFRESRTNMGIEGYSYTVAVDHWQTRVCKNEQTKIETKRHKVMQTRPTYDNG